MNIVRSTTKTEALESAKRFLSDEIKKHKHNPLLILLSGGSSLNLLTSAQEFGSNVTIGMLDDRYSTDEQINNFSQLQKTPFFQSAEKASSKFIDTRVQIDESLESFGERFDTELKKWKEKNPNGIIIATQGVGPDGHTSGILPLAENPSQFAEWFDDDKIWGIGYEARADKNQYTKRITVTLSFLRMLDIIIVYMTGAEKRTALNNILSEQGSLYETPARILREEKNVYLFTDIQE